MLCDRCKKRPPRVYITSFVDEVSVSTGICNRCYKTAYRKDYLEYKAEIAAGCSFCGKKCGTFMCSACLSEYRRVMEMNGFGKYPFKIGREDRANLFKVLHHMRRWASEKRGKPWHPDFSRGIRLHPIFQKFVEADSRFKIEAYDLAQTAVRRAIADADKERPELVTGREVALAFCAAALELYEETALETLIACGVYTTDDIGTIVFRLSNAGYLSVPFHGKLEEFHAVYDFASAFRSA